MFRPESPPPRQPSPEPVYTRPLAPRPRRQLVNMQSVPSIQLPPAARKTLISSRSDEQLRHKSSPRSTFLVSPASESHSAPSSPRPGSFRQVHQRSLSTSRPRSRSPPPSPQLPMRPPPVPPIPSFVLNPTDKKPVIQRRPASDPIHLDVPVAASRSNFARKKGPSIPDGRDMLSISMTCSKFFSIRNSSHKPARTCAV